MVSCGPPPANNSATVEFNQNDIAALQQEIVNLAEPDQVFDLVFAQLPAEMMVYPSEGYYYFRLQNGPADVRGNIRFDSEKTDQGVIAFSYNSPTSFAFEDVVSHFSWRSVAEGVTITKLADRKYEMIYQGLRKVVTIYNGTPGSFQAVPLGEDEEYVGPVYDESGVQFHLVFNSDLNFLFYVLNELVPQTERFTALEEDSQILLGNRTSFAFYQDTSLKRKILVGVRYVNIKLNNYYDGPFDQLPDWFVAPAALQHYIEEAYPHERGQIGLRGIYLDDEGMRVSVNAYYKYLSFADLLPFDECDSIETDNTALLGCLRNSIYRD